MAELTIRNCSRVEENRGFDGHTWRCSIEDPERPGREHPLVVELARAEATRSGARSADLDRLLPAALQRFADEVLLEDVNVLDQVKRWGGPVRLKARHFKGAS